MKSLVIIIFFLTFCGGLLFAQPVKNYGTDFFKNEAETSSQKSLHISDFRYQDNLAPDSFLDYPREKPVAAFLSSAIVPGSGQALNGKWARAGIYFTAEVVGIIYHLDRNAKARRQEKAYEAITHKNWSVVAYAQWLVNYSMQNGLNNGWENLESTVSGKSPDFSNTTNDWAKVDIDLLRSVENHTAYVFDNHYGSEFSHELPNYGSQQYYELISKYYQYQPGWKDWYEEITLNSEQNQDLYRYMWNGQDQPFDLFYEGRDRAEEFNDNYRVAGNILKLLLVNHVVSAFDALFTVQLQNSRIQTEANLLKYEQLSVTWHF